MEQSLVTVEYKPVNGKRVSVEVSPEVKERHNRVIETEWWCHGICTNFSKKYQQYDKKVNN